MSPRTSEDRQRLLRELQQSQKKQKAKLIFLSVLLGAVLVVYFMAGKSRPETAPEPTQEQLISEVSLPPVDHAALATVADAREEDRILLEGGPFRDLSRVALALLPAHLDALRDPALPFAELESRSAELRGRPFRVRGELRSIRTLRRKVELPEETWCWLRTDAGEDCFFVSVNAPDAGLAAGDYVLADGFYFKRYSQSLDGARVEAPLLVGRELIGSVREAAPAAALDFALLAEVEDHPHGAERPLDEAAKWHLLGHAKWAAQDPARIEAAFAEAPLLDYEGLARLAENPAAYRGKAFRIPGRVPQTPRYTGSEPAGENPLRDKRLNFGWLGNPLVFGQNPIRMISGDAFRFTEPGGRIYSGWFLQLQGYVDNENAPRRAPVFVVVADEKAPDAAPSIFGASVWWCLGLGGVLAALVAWLTRRDRIRSTEASRALREKRASRRPAPGPPGAA
jgi:hypothetical protein